MQVALASLILRVALVHLQINSILFPLVGQVFTFD